MPTVWGRLESCLLSASWKNPKMTKGHAGKPHPAPQISRLPQPLADWYDAKQDTGTGVSWVTELGGEQFARLPSLTWVPGAD